MEYSPQPWFSILSFPLNVVVSLVVSTYLEELSGFVSLFIGSWHAMVPLRIAQNWKGSRSIGRVTSTFL